MSTSAFEIPEKRVFRIDEAARILTVSRPTIYRWCSIGKITAIRIAGRSMRIDRDSIVKIIKIDE